MILCVDSSEADRDATRAALDSIYEVETTASLSDARSVLTERTVECLVTEYDLPDGTGLELIRAARNDAPDAACILFTDTPLDDIDTAAFGDVVAEYLSKDDPAGHDEQAINTLAQFCSGRIEVRDRDGRAELRTRGLADQPREWTPFDAFP